MNDRLTKEDMKRDALLEQTASAADFAVHHVRSIVIGAVVVVVAALGFMFFRSNQAKSEDRAAGILQDAQFAYDNGNFVGAANHINELERNLGGTRSGKLSRTLAGNIHAALGQWQEALIDYERAASDHRGDPILEATAMRGQASALESLGRNQEAADIYRALADETGNEAARAELLANVARNLLAAGDTAQARAILEEVSAMSSNPRVAQMASLRLAELERQ